MTFRGPLFAVNYSAWSTYVLSDRNGWQQRNPYTLRGQDTFYSAPGQSPPGSYATPPPIDWRNGYTISLVLGTLKGQDTFYGAPGQSPPGSFATPPPIEWRNGFTLSLVNSTLNRPVGKSTAPPRHEVDWRNGWTQSTILLYPPSPPPPFSARSYATPPPIEWRNGFTLGTTALRLPIPSRPPGKQSFATPFPIDWRNGFTRGTTALFFPGPLPPPGPLRQLRDYWDRDEWGTFIPGAAVRDAIGVKQTQEFVTKTWKVDN